MKELLLFLSDYHCQSSDYQRLSALFDEVSDWDKLVKLINAHGIIALAAYNIKKAGLSGRIPEKSMKMLENGLMQSVVRNLWLLERWKEVNTLLSHNGINHILLKGMALEHTIYGSSGLRQMSDNDILIEEKSALEAWNLLCKNGFEPAEIKSRFHKKIMFDIKNHLPALFKDGYAVDIHTEKNLPFIVFKENERISDYCEIFTINDISAYKLKDDIHLKFLQNHLERHAEAGECQLRSFADLKLLDPSGKHFFPEAFIYKPDQTAKLRFRKTQYKKTVRLMNKSYRVRFILGDMFPSIKWMKKRYRCNTAYAILRYPVRVGKLLWLI